MYIDIYLKIYINGESHTGAGYCSPHSFSYNIHLNFRT